MINESSQMKILEETPKYMVGLLRSYYDYYPIGFNKSFICPDWDPASPANRKTKVTICRNAKKELLVAVVPVSTVRNEFNDEWGIVIFNKKNGSHSHISCVSAQSNTYSDWKAKNDIHLKYFNYYKETYTTEGSFQWVSLLLNCKYDEWTTHELDTLYKFIIDKNVYIDKRMHITDKIKSVMRSSKQIREKVGKQFQQILDRTYTCTSMQ